MTYYRFKVDKDLFYLIEQSLEKALKIAMNNMARLREYQEDCVWVERIDIQRTINLEKDRADDISKLITSLKQQSKKQNIKDTMSNISKILDKRKRTGEIVKEPKRTITNPFG